MKLTLCFLPWVAHVVVAIHIDVMPGSRGTDVIQDLGNCTGDGDCPSETICINSETGDLCGHGILWFHPECNGHCEVCWGGAPNYAGCCVTADPAYCSGGTMDLDKLTDQTLLATADLDLSGKFESPDDSALLIDRASETWTFCKDSAIQPSPKPCKVAPSITGKVLLYFGVVVQLLLLFCGCRFLGKYDLVVVWWYSDFWAHLMIGFIGHLQGLDFLFSWWVTKFMWDLPIMIAKTCSEKCKCIWSFRSVCIIVSGVYMASGIAGAYNPDTIALLGHHAILFGLLNFATSYPQNIVQGEIQRILRERCSRCPSLLIGSPDNFSNCYERAFYSPLPKIERRDECGNGNDTTS